MRIYNCVVRVGGQIFCEVPKQKVTAAEIITLRSMHGQESVVRIEPVGQDRRAHVSERDRLGAIYGDDLVHRLFGEAHVKLPVELDKTEEAAIADAAAKGEVALRAKLEAMANEEFEARVKAEVERRLDEMTGPEDAPEGEKG